MFSYDDLIASLEDAWLMVGLHEHALIESVVPATQERMSRIELFPEHPEPLTIETMPPWIELNFTWSPAHQLLFEGLLASAEPLELSWTYMATTQSSTERTDLELVRMFQRAVHAAFQLHYPNEAAEMDPVAVEVRRIYQARPSQDGHTLALEAIQLTSTTLVNLLEQWPGIDSQVLQQILQLELQLSRTIINNLAETFNPRGHSSYRSVDAA
jgi:hypothetical protein